MVETLSLVVVSLIWPNQNLEKPAAPTPIKVALCELIRNPGQYESKEVEVRGTYRYAFETSELYCLECFDQGRMWVRFDDELKVPGGLRGYGGTFNVQFTGIFRGNGHFGHLNGSSSELEVRRVQLAKKLYKFGVVPSALPSHVRKKVCGAQRNRP